MRRGLSPREWQQIREKEHSYLGEAVTTVTPFTGISSNALAHLRDEWISFEDDLVRIHIPAEDSCNDYKAVSGAPGSNELPIQERRTEPCYYCKTTGVTNQFENLQPVGETSSFLCELILHREIAAPAVDFLENVFNVYGRSEIGVKPGVVGEAARRVLNSDSEGNAYPKLKRTAPVIYAYYGLSPNDISQLTAYSKSTAKAIVGETPEVNFENMNTATFLRIISNNDPATISKLAEKTDLSKETVHRRLTHLKEEDRVSVLNNNPGLPPATWETADDWKEPFRCDDCGYTSYSLSGIRLHKKKAHKKRA